MVVEILKVGFIAGMVIIIIPFLLGIASGMKEGIDEILRKHKDKDN